MECNKRAEPALNAQGFRCTHTFGASLREVQCRRFIVCITVSATTAATPLAVLLVDLKLTFVTILSQVRSRGQSDAVRALSARRKGYNCVARLQDTGCYNTANREFAMEHMASAGGAGVLYYSYRQVFH